MRGKRGVIGWRYYLWGAFVQMYEREFLAASWPTIRIASWPHPTGTGGSVLIKRQRTAVTKTKRMEEG